MFGEAMDPLKSRRKVVFEPSEFSGNLLKTGALNFLL